MTTRIAAQKRREFTPQAAVGLREPMNGVVIDL
jgi:hypothetical protein